MYCLERNSIFKKANSINKECMFPNKKNSEAHVQVNVSKKTLIDACSN